MKATNIIWDTDGEVIDLPQQVTIPQDVEDVTDYLSDLTGFCVFSYSLE